MFIITIKLEIKQNCYTKDNIYYLPTFWPFLYIIIIIGHFFHHLATFQEEFWPLIIFISGNPVPDNPVIMATIDM